MKSKKFKALLERLKVMRFSCHGNIAVYNKDLEKSLNKYLVYITNECHDDMEFHEEKWRRIGRAEALGHLRAEVFVDRNRWFFIAEDEKAALKELEAIPLSLIEAEPWDGEEDEEEE